jgi:hypothetical protein
LDGHNNPGFSGGPVLFKEQEHGKLKVAAVVSGYRFANEPVYHGEQKLPVTYRYNTGIVISYGIKHAVRLQLQVQSVYPPPSRGKREASGSISRRVQASSFLDSPPFTALPSQPE